MDLAFPLNQLQKGVPNISRVSGDGMERFRLINSFETIIGMLWDKCDAKTTPISNTARHRILTVFLLVRPLSYGL